MTSNTDPMEKTVESVCECGQYVKVVTFGNLKNKWPRCKCKLAMKVKSNAVSSV